MRSRRARRLTLDRLGGIESNNDSGDHQKFHDDEIGQDESRIKSNVLWENVYHHSVLFSIDIETNWCTYSRKLWTGHPA